MSKPTQKFCKSASEKIKISDKQIQSEPCRACSHLRTAPSGADGGEGNKTGGITLPDNVRFLLENFKSLYQEDFQCEKAKTGKENSQSFPFNKKEARKSMDAPTMKFSGENSRERKGKEEIEADDVIAILTYSPSPYNEFRRSMAEMVEVPLRRGERVDWDFLEELLFRYLDLNNEKAHRYVLRAFVDLVVVLHENDWKSLERHRQPWDGGAGGRRLNGKI